jgi:hypothetical protein
MKLLQAWGRAVRGRGSSASGKSPVGGCQVGPPVGAACLRLRASRGTEHYAAYPAKQLRSCMSDTHTPACRMPKQR